MPNQHILDKLLRNMEWLKKFEPCGSTLLEMQACRVCYDLVELHDRNSLSLDNWDSVRDLVKTLTNMDVVENGV